MEPQHKTYTKSPFSGAKHTGTASYFTPSQSKKATKFGSQFSQTPPFPSQFENTPGQAPEILSTGSKMYVMDMCMFWMCVSVCMFMLRMYVCYVAMDVCYGWMLCRLWIYVMDLINSSYGCRLLSKYVMFVSYVVMDVYLCYGCMYVMQLWMFVMDLCCVCYGYNIVMGVCC